LTDTDKLDNFVKTLKGRKMKYLILFGLFFALNSFGQTVFNWGIDRELFYHIRIAKEFKAFIESKTQNRVKINIDVYDVKNENQSIQSYIESGKYQITQSGTGNFEQVSPLVKVWEIPFLFEDFKHAEKYIVSKNAQNVLAKFTNGTMQAIDYTYSGGPLYIFSQKKMNSFDDLVGEKFSLANDNGFSKEFLEPRKIIGLREGDLKQAPSGEILGAGVDGIYTRDDASQLWVNITNHRMITRIVGVSQKALASLSDSDRSLFVKEIKRLMKEERKFSMRGFEIGQELMKNRGTQVNVWDRKTKEIEFKKFNYSPERYANLQSEIEYIQKLSSKQGFIRRTTASEK